MKRIIGIAFATAGLALLFSAPATARRAEMPPLPVGAKAPDFKATAWTGKPLHLSDFHGKIVVLDFWASWCPPCNQAMPHLQDLLNQYKSDIVLLAVCVQDTPGAANNWVRSHPYTFTYAFDQIGDSTHYSPTLDAYHVWGIPTTYVIDPQGNIAAGHTMMEESDIVTAIRKLGARTESDLAQAK